jgi:hypothetical protein
MNRPPPIIAAGAMISEARTKRIDPASKLAMNLVKGFRSEGREASGNRYSTITKVKIKDVKMDAIATRTSTLCHFSSSS